MQSLKALEGATGAPTSIHGEAWDTFHVSNAASSFSLSNIAKLTTLLLSLSGCNNAVGERASSQRVAEHIPVHQPIEQKREPLSQSSVEILHLPQIHNHPDGTHPPKVREAVSRFQFELAKRILGLIQAEPTTVVFSEGKSEELSADTLLQTRASQILSELATKVEIAEGVVTVLKPIPQDSPSKSVLQGIHSILEPITRHVVHDGKTLSIVNESELVTFLRNTELQELGLTDGFPETYEDANEYLKTSLYDGAVSLLLSTGLVKTVYPVEKQSTLKKIVELRIKEQFNDMNTKGEGAFGPPAFGDLLVENRDTRDLIVRQREADLAEQIKAYVSDPAHSETRRVLVVFGANHDLSEEFDSFPKFIRDEKMDTKIRELFGNR